jgi:hypothetical protein
MEEQFTFLSLWPHAVLVIVLAIACLRVRSRNKLIAICVVASLGATALYWWLQNGVAPPRQSARTGQLIALWLAGAIPFIGVVLIGSSRSTKLPEAARMVTAILIGLLLTIFLSGFQMLLGCGFTGICP